MLTESRKKRQKALLSFLNQNSFCQLIVYIVSSVLDRDGAAALSVSNYGDRFAAVATESEEESIQLLIVGLDLFYNIFLAFDSIFECHLFFTMCFADICDRLA